MLSWKKLRLLPSLRILPRVSRGVWTYGKNGATTDNHLCILVLTVNGLFICILQTANTSTTGWASLFWRLGNAIETAILLKLYAISCGLQGYIQYYPPEVNLFKSPSLAGFRKVLDGEIKRLCSIGLGVSVKQAEPNEENQLCEKGVLHLNHWWIVCSFYVVSILPYEVENIVVCRFPSSL